MPIPGTQNPFHLEENLRALNIELSAEDMETIEQQFPDINVMGVRSSEAVLSQSDTGATLDISLEDGKELTPRPYEGWREK